RRLKDRHVGQAVAVEVARDGDIARLAECHEARLSVRPGDLELPRPRLGGDPIERPIGPGVAEEVPLTEDPRIGHGLPREAESALGLVSTWLEPRGVPPNFDLDAASRLGHLEDPRAGLVDAIAVGDLEARSSD